MFYRNEPVHLNNTFDPLNLNVPAPDNNNTLSQATDQVNLAPTPSSLKESDFLPQTLHNQTFLIA